MDQLLKTMAEAKVVVKGEHIRAGRGRFLITKCLDLKEATNGRTFVAELKVVSSESKGDVDPKTKEPIVPNGVGALCSYAQPLAAKPQVALPNTKGFVCATLGVDPNAVTGSEFVQAYEDMTGPKQLAAGMYVDYSTRQHITKKNEEITLVNFTHVSEKNGNSASEIQARRAAL